MFAEVPLHPKLVHLSLALAALMPLLSLGVLLAWWRGWMQQRTWSIVVAVQAVLVLGSVVAMRSGESDEERAEAIVPEAAIEQHEEAAEAFQWSAVAVLVVGILPLLLRDRRRAQLAALATAIGTGAVLVLAIRTGEKGGELVYRHGAAAAFVNAPAGLTNPALPAKGDDDGDH